MNLGKLSLFAIFVFIFAFNPGHSPAASLPQLPANLIAELEHLDPEMSSEELRERLDSLRLHQSEATEWSERLYASPLEVVLATGKRNLVWISFINEARRMSNSGPALVLNSPATQAAFPVESPSVSNGKRVLQRFEDLKLEMPEGMKEVLQGTSAFPAQIPAGLDDAKFLELARKLDRIYSSASRWLLEEPFLWKYKALAWKDIRGFYHLSKISDLDEKLTHYSELDPSVQSDLKKWLIGQCLNSKEGRQPCLQHFNESIHQEGNALAFHARYQSAAQSVFDSFFKIQNERSDTQWVTQTESEIFTVPFRRPETSEVETFLMNIENEWHWGAWQLRLHFEIPGATAMNAKTPHLVFKPGATAHVNGVGGSQITMDSNRPLTDYTAQWTIRHEFGHVLGFPDCYHEFYDEDEQAMINYQLDTTNLMCSRRGKLQEKQVAELRRVYSTSN